MPEYHRAKRHGQKMKLTPALERILSIIERIEPCTVKQVMKASNRTKGSTSEHLTSLYYGGWVERTGSVNAGYMYRKVDDNG